MDSKNNQLSIRMHSPHYSPSKRSRIHSRLIDFLRATRIKNGGSKLTSSDIIKKCEDFLLLNNVYTKKLLRLYLNREQLINYLMGVRYNQENSQFRNEYYEHWINYLQENRHDKTLYSRFNNDVMPVNYKDVEFVINFVVRSVDEYDNNLLLF